MSIFLSDVFNGSTVKSQDHSKVLQGHFAGKPIVPGVILELFAKTAAKTQGIAGFEHSIRCDFDNSVGPKDALRVQYDPSSGLQCFVSSSESVAFTIKPTEDIPLVQNESIPSYKESCREILDDHLLQSGDFRFADFGEIQSDGTIFGYYELPETHALYDDGEGFGREILQESANQIVSLAHSRYHNPNGARTGKSILLKQSKTTALTPDKVVRLIKGDILYVVGKMLPQSLANKRTIGAILTGYNYSFHPIFSAEIRGTEIQTRVLFR